MYSSVFWKDLSRFLKRNPLLIVTLLLFSVCLASPAMGARVMLEWDRVSDSDVTGYRIYYGTSSGDYTKHIEVSDPSRTQATVDGLKMGTQYYFSAASYNSNQESGYTQEVSHTPADSDGDGLSDYDEAHFYPTDPDVADTDGDGIDDGAELAYWKSQEGKSWDGDIDGDGTVNLVDPDSNDDGIQDGSEYVDSETRTVVIGETLDADYSNTAADTYINMNRNTYDESATLNTYTYPQDIPANAAILKFDLSNIPEGAYIQSAELKLYQTHADGDPTYDVSVHKIINHDPVLAQSTGYTYDGSNSWTSNDVRDDGIPLAQADIAPTEEVNSLDQSQGYKTWNVTQMVRDWVNNRGSNYGMLLNSDDAASQDSYRFFASSEAPDGTVRPKLVVEFSSSNDSDNDGISDYEEKNIYHTDPNVADTDGDGIDDGTELAYWKDQDGYSWDDDIDGDGRINLLDPDADGDGYDDGTEYAASTDPAKDSSHPEPEAPKALAGVDQTVSPGSRVTLDASNSFDPDNDITSYSWKQIDGPDTTTMENSDSVRASFTASDFTDGYAFELTVEDSTGNTDKDICFVNVAKNASNVPDATINASKKGVLQPHEEVTLTAPAIDNGSYQWRQLSGPDFDLSGNGTQDLSFTVESDKLVSNATALVFSLAVETTSGLKAGSKRIVNVSQQEDATPPTADAGQDTQTSEGETVFLNGWNSQDDSAISSFSWRQVAGPQVTLSKPRSASPYFVAPNVEEPAEIRFQLTVRDDTGLADADTVTVRVQNNVKKPQDFNPHMDEDNAIVLPKSTLQNSRLAIQTDMDSSVTSFQTKDPSDVSNQSDSPARISFKLFDYEIKVAKPGDTARITYYFDTPIPEGHEWFKYNPQSGTWSLFPGKSQMSADRMSTTLILTDGGPSDQDGEENGVIVDPAALGSSVASDDGSETDTESNVDAGNAPSSGGGGCVYDPEANPGWGWFLLLASLLLMRPAMKRRTE